MRLLWIFTKRRFANRISDIGKFYSGHSKLNVGQTDTRYFGCIVIRVVVGFQEKFIKTQTISMDCHDQVVGEPLFSQERSGLKNKLVVIFSFELVLLPPQMFWMIFSFSMISFIKQRIRILWFLLILAVILLSLIVKYLSFSRSFSFSYFIDVGSILFIFWFFFTQGGGCLTHVSG